MFTKSKFLKVVLPFLLAATVLTAGSPSASAAGITYPCNSGQTYRVTAGVVSDGRYCTGTFTIDASATSIGDYAFQSGTAIQSVTIQSGVTSIGEAAFYGASSLNAISLPSSLQSIGASAFRFTAFTSFTIPSGVNSIGTFALINMTSLTSFMVDSSNANYSAVGGVLFNKLQTQLIQYPRTTTATSYVVPSSVTTISSYSFYDISSLTSITFPSTVTSFGSNIFPFMSSPITSYTYCGSASLTGTGITGTRTSCSTAPGAPTIGTATATGTTTATVAFTAPASDGGSTILSYTATSSPGSVTATITQATSGTISITGLSASTSYTFTITALNSVGASLASAASNSITTFAPGISPLFTSPSSYDGRFTVQISDYDSAFTYAVTSSAGQASVNSTGLVTVTGLLPDQSVTVSVITTRTGYAPGSGSVTGRSQVAPMLPGTKPVIETTETTVMCTIGSYSATPTSSAFSLFVDGKHVSTIFSALGEYLPDWIIPWATSSTITRTATLTSATWTISDAYKGKSITCATLAYSKNAIGFTISQALIAR